MKILLLHSLLLFSVACSAQTVKQFQDSGRYENNLKEGRWIEYSVDSSKVGQSFVISIGNRTEEIKYEADYYKNTGNYSKGKKEGLWISYKKNSTDVSWNRKATTTYKGGEKNGQEIIYQGYGNDQQPLVVHQFRNGREEGKVLVFDYNSPYHLQEIYEIKNGRNYLLARYYPNGNLKIQVKDTVVKGDSEKVARWFFENGSLERTGIFCHDSLACGQWTTYFKDGKVKFTVPYSANAENGVYKCYHQNGQLWSEVLYKNGKTMEVLSNYDQNGHPQKKGTLKNGNGTRLMYSEDGTLREVLEYRDGEEVKK